MVEEIVMIVMIMIVLHMVEEIAMSMTMKVLNMVREIVMIMAIYDGGYANVEQVKHECLLSNQKKISKVIHR